MPEPWQGHCVVNDSCTLIHSYLPIITFHFYKMLKIHFPHIFFIKKYRVTVADLSISIRWILISFSHMTCTSWSSHVQNRWYCLKCFLFLFIQLQGISSKQRTPKINLALAKLYIRVGMDRSAITSYKEVLR